jgi:hypothetical protein
MNRLSHAKIDMLQDISVRTKAASGKTVAAFGKTKLPLREA